MNIATPCTVCATKAQRTGSAFYAARGEGWPVTEVAGHVVHKTCASEAEHLARSAADGTLAIGADGVATWTTNGQPVPDHCAVLLVALGLGEGIDLDATKAASDAATAEAVARYREAQPAVPSAEELAEMRAAFGPGAKVVNVMTGREVQL
jgi:hypothetical protein